MSEYGLYHPEYEREGCGVACIADVQRRDSRALVENARTILVRLSHRGAHGSESNTGDGAGILTNIPDTFFRSLKTEFDLPLLGRYAAGIIFLPKDKTARDACKKSVNSAIKRYGAKLLFWRTVPVDNSMIGATSLAAEPYIEQLFVAKAANWDGQEFERKLYLIRKYATRTVRDQGLASGGAFYVCSLSAKTIVYKGMLTNAQLFDYYLDLQSDDYTAYVAMIHSRFATNTFPSWERTHPFRFTCHNGEINTIRGNINNMRAREGVLKSELFGDAIKDLFPIMEPDTADSANFDNSLELLHLGGRALDEAVLLMIPEAWQSHTTMNESRRAWYEFNSCFMEPWDGPAAILSCNGDSVAAMLDRNGLRPLRYYHTTDDQIIISSEVGALPLAPEQVAHKGRLQSGRLFLIDFVNKQVVDGDVRKDEVAMRHRYSEWLATNRITFDALELPKDYKEEVIDNINLYARAFGHSDEHIRLILKPMLMGGKDPLGSMGNDAPLAVLSEKPRLLFDYFHQLFAQVTNPAIDSIRERNFMSLLTYIGPQGDILKPNAKCAERLLLEHPVLSDEECARIVAINHKGWRSRSIDITYPISNAPKGIAHELDRICKEVDAALEEGCALIILSDKAVSAERISIGALLSCGTVHHHLLRRARRTRIGIVVQTGEAREVHHFCCLAGYGADAVHPYVAYQLLRKLSQTDEIKGELGKETVEERYRTALDYGIRKVLAKMGISTLESYKGAQIFEIVGLASEVVDRSFAGTASRVGGIGYEQLAEEMMRWHHLAFGSQATSDSLNFGEYQWRVNQETHMWDPKSIALIRKATRQGDYKAFKEFSSYVDSHLVNRATLRGSLDFVNKNPIPIDQVEPIEEIMKRFVTGAMSFGSLSIEAHETLALAMNRIGGKSNTGEGGEGKERFTALPNGDSRRSAIKQVASGRFGVTIEYLTNADEIQIKVAQGAKPGEGGELPGHKVSPAIAKERYSIPGVGLISPPPHHDIYSIEDLAQLIFDLKNANPAARISVKLVAAVGVGIVAAGVAKAHADHILISGYDGGTGASALTGIKHAGLPWELGISETHQVLVMNDLRSRVTLQTDGQLKTGRDVVVAALLGAEECGFSTAPLIVLGCIMMRKCEKNTCPVGVATQNEKLRAKFDGKPEYVVNYMRYVAQEVRELMAELGFRRFTDMIGKTSYLRFNKDRLPKKSKGLDLMNLLAVPRMKNTTTQVYHCIEQDHDLDSVLDRDLIAIVNKALDEKKLHIPSPSSDTQEVKNTSTPPTPHFVIEKNIHNNNRTTCGMLSHELCKRFGLFGIPEGTIGITVHGSAGQSFGAWLIRGIVLTIYGDTNDYPGKGLSGGTIVARPPLASTFEASSNVIIGNVGFYGATMGKAFICGRAAERFCVRNSGAHVVVEGVGDHGCEYMTGGRVVIIGWIGRNFAAGMSGGIAYVYYPGADLTKLVNTESVIMCDLDEDDDDLVHRMITEHVYYTDSVDGKEVLQSWDTVRSQFVKIISPVYKNILELQKSKRS